MARVLIISHQPIISSMNMGKTMLSLFSDFPKEDLCQFYIYPNLPDTDLCASVYRTTDKDVLRSFYRFHVAGRVLTDADYAAATSARFEDGRDERFYANKKNRAPFRMLMRDVMWSLSRWYNRPLRAWLDGMRPDVIFVTPGSANFLYKIAEKIASDRKIPVVTYLCDDYYFVKTPSSFWGKRQSLRLRDEIARLCRQSACLVTICDDMSHAYEAEFGTPAVTVMTGATIPVAEAPTEREARSVTYMGNIQWGRVDSLLAVGEEIARINEERGTDFTLDIYTGEKDESLLSRLRGARGIRLFGFVTGDAYREVFDGAAVHLHTEGFDEAAIDLVKRSVSTKIADCLASGTCLLAYGPAEVASMQHLIRNDCAVVATTRDALRPALEAVFFSPNVRRETAARALSVAREYHAEGTASRLLSGVMKEVCHDHSAD